MFDKVEFKDKIKKRIWITGLLTLVFSAYFLFAPSPFDNLGLGMVLIASLIGLIVSAVALIYYTVKFVGV